MYGAKAQAIANAALGTWAFGKAPTVKTRNAVTATILQLGMGEIATVAELPAAADGFPDVLRHQEFLNLVRTLADHPLVA